MTVRRPDGGSCELETVRRTWQVKHLMETSSLSGFIRVSFITPEFQRKKLGPEDVK